MNGVKELSANGLGMRAFLMMEELCYGLWLRLRFVVCVRSIMMNIFCVTVISALLQEISFHLPPFPASCLLCRTNSFIYHNSF